MLDKKIPFVDFSPAQDIIMWHDDMLDEWFAHRTYPGQDTWHIYSRAGDGALDHRGIVRAEISPSPKRLQVRMILAGITAV
jgi:hypothetical protein